MAGWNFNADPTKVPKVNTKYRKIVTRLPVPASAKLFKELERYESRSMHGQMPVVWDRAEDFQVYDGYGNCWIDFTSTIFVANSGHSNRRVIKYIRETLDRRLIHTYTFVSKIRARFLKKLVDMTPSFCEKAFLLSSGTEATECALKLMKMRGQTIARSKTGIISFRGCMHGRTMAVEMLKGDDKSSEWIGYKDPNIFHMPFPYPWLADGRKDAGVFWKSRFKKDIADLKNNGVRFEDICGIMIESYQGWGAVFYPKEYIRELFIFARKYNILVTFDEIQSGMCRTGKLFAYQHYGVEPDLLCLGKGLSGGLPLSAVIGRKSILDLPDVGSMSSTHSANPICCAAGLANLEEIERLDLTRVSARKGALLHQRLKKLKAKFPDNIARVIGKGMVAALIVTDPVTHKPDGRLASIICEKAMQKGLLLVHTGRESIKIGPPLTISNDALLEGISVLEECFAEIER